MCGIVGMIGTSDAAPLLLDGLKRLEYRGYDSAGIATLGLALAAAASPAHAATCAAEGEPRYGAEAPLMIDADCMDPDYNESNFVIDSTKSLTLALPDGSSVPYTEVKGHFPATHTAAQLPEGVTGSPTTASHAVTWMFPDRAHWRNRFFQQSYPLPFESEKAKAKKYFDMMPNGVLPLA